MQKKRNGRRLPVVAVDDIHAAHIGNGRQHALAEKDIALGLVVVAVELVPVKVVGIIHEIEGDPLRTGQHAQAALLMTPAYGNGEMGDQLHLIAELGALGPKPVVGRAFHVQHEAV